MAEVLAVGALLQRDDLADPVAGSLDCFRDVSARVVKKPKNADLGHRVRGAEHLGYPVHVWNQDRPGLSQRLLDRDRLL